MDVGAGIGSISLSVAKANPNLRFVIQDRASVIIEGKEVFTHIIPMYMSVELPNSTGTKNCLARLPLAGFHSKVRIKQRPGSASDSVSRA